MKSRQSQTLLLLVIVILGLACGWGAKATEVSYPTPPHSPVKPNQAAIERAKENFYLALYETSATQPFEFRVSNEEVTSLVAWGLQQRADIPFANPQIWFSNKRIYITGNFTGLGGDGQPAFIIIKPAIINEKLSFEIEMAKVGDFDFPAGLIDNVSQTIEETLAEYQADIRLTTVTVEEGELFIIGKQVTSP